MAAIPAALGREREQALEIDVEPAAAAALVARAAEAWGAELEDGGARAKGGGRVRLPVTAGIRQGWISGVLRLEPAAPPRSGTRLTFQAEESVYHVQPAPVFVLVLAALGALLTVVWPFVPRLLPVAPLGALLALGGWLLVVSRLRTSGPEEFLQTIAALAGAQRRPAGGGLPGEEGPAA
jgi:hypothetical protein